MSQSTREAKAFQAYFEMGTARSLRALRDLLRTDPGAHGLKRAPSLRTLEGWSARFRWGERLAEIERESLARDQEQRIEHAREYRERLRQEGLVLQKRGLTWLQSKDESDVRASEAIKAIAEGFRLEALALGEATERVEITQEAYSDVIGQLTDEELERLVTLLRAAPPPGADGAEPAAS